MSSGRRVTLLWIPRYLLVCLIGLFVMTGIAAQTPHSDPSVDTLIAELSAAQADTRLQALNQLAELGPYAGQASEAVLQVARNDPDGEVRLAAVRTLGKIDQVFVRWLILSLDQDDPELRAFAVASLAVIGSPQADAAREKLQELADNDPDGQVRILAAEVLRLLLAPPAASAPEARSSGVPPQGA